MAALQPYAACAARTDSWLQRMRALIRKKQLSATLMHVGTKGGERIH